MTFISPATKPAIVVRTCYVLLHRLLRPMVVGITIIIANELFDAIQKYKGDAVRPSYLYLASARKLWFLLICNSHTEECFEHLPLMTNFTSTCVCYLKHFEFLSLPRKKHYTISIEIIKTSVADIVRMYLFRHLYPNVG